MNVLVVVPTYNERDNLAPLARSVLARPDYRLLVVDDGSPDGTGAVADALASEFPGRVHVIHRSGPRGLGLSYREGFKWALTTDAELIGQMDADFSHDPKYLEDLVEAAASHDLAIGSRYLHGVSVINWPIWRIVLSVGANRYVRWLTRLPARDCTSGFRCWRRQALARLPIERMISEGYAFQIEMLYEAARRGMQIFEIPIVFVERRRGRSKLSASVSLEALLIPWRLVIGRRRR